MLFHNLHLDSTTGSVDVTPGILRKVCKNTSQSVNMKDFSMLILHRCFTAFLTMRCIVLCCFKEMYVHLTEKVLVIFYRFFFLKYG